MFYRKIQMNVVRLVIISFFTVYAATASKYATASPVELTCVNPKDGFSISIVFDVTTNLVSVNSGVPISAYINASLIEFDLTVGGKKYFHRINRSSGAMMIKDVAKDVVLPTYECSVSHKRF